MKAKIRGRSGPEGIGVELGPMIDGYRAERDINVTRRIAHVIGIELAPYQVGTVVTWAGLDDAILGFAVGEELQADGVHILEDMGVLSLTSRTLSDVVCVLGFDLDSASFLVADELLDLQFRRILQVNVELGSDAVIDVAVRNPDEASGQDDE